MLSTRLAIPDDDRMLAAICLYVVYIEREMRRWRSAVAGSVRRGDDRRVRSPVGHVENDVRECRFCGGTSKLYEIRLTYDAYYVFHFLVAIMPLFLPLSQTPTSIYDTFFLLLLIRFFCFTLFLCYCTTRATYTNNVIANWREVKPHAHIHVLEIYLISLH